MCKQIYYIFPISNLILNGITRQLVMRLAKQLQFPVIEAPFTKDELMKMDEVFITNTGVNVCPIVEIDGLTIGTGECGIITEILKEAFNELIIPKVKQ